MSNTGRLHRNLQVNGKRFIQPFQALEEVCQVHRYGTINATDVCTGRTQPGAEMPNRRPTLYHLGSSEVHCILHLDFLRRQQQRNRQNIVSMAVMIATGTPIMIHMCGSNRWHILLMSTSYANPAPNLLCIPRSESCLSISKKPRRPHQRCYRQQVRVGTQAQWSKELRSAYQLAIANIARDTSSSTDVDAIRCIRPTTTRKLGPKLAGYISGPWRVGRHGVRSIYLPPTNRNACRMRSCRTVANWQCWPAHRTTSALWSPEPIYNYRLRL